MQISYMAIFNYFTMAFSFRIQRKKFYNWQAEKMSSYLPRDLCQSNVEQFWYIWAFLLLPKKQMAVKILPKIYTKSHWALCDFLFVLGTFLVANLTVK